MHISLHHNTTYAYDRSVVLGPHDIRLRPSAHGRTSILSYGLTAQPGGEGVKWYSDAPGNSVARFIFSAPVHEIAFDVRLEAILEPRNPFDFLLDPSAVEYPFRYSEDDAEELAPLLQPELGGESVDEWIRTFQSEVLGAGSIATIDVLIEVCRRIRSQLRYVVREEPGVQTPEQTLGLGSGSCRDSSWLAIQILRRLSVAARFVSGYLIQSSSIAMQRHSASTEAQSQVSPMQADLHAWFEVYLPGAGWLGVDPTSGLLTGEGHIPLAVGRKPSATAPVTGSTSSSQARLTHRLEVEPLSSGKETSGFIQRELSW